MHKLQNQRGFGLFEVLISLVVGLVTTLVISQVYTAFEGQKRTTVNGGDAQTFGATGLYIIERDAKNAGYGMGMLSALGCKINSAFNGVDQPPMTFSPIAIVNGAGGAPDTIQFMASTVESFSLPIRVNKQMPSSSAEFKVDTKVGVQDGDLLIAWQSGVDCTLVQATKDTSASSPGAKQVQHNPGNDALWNPPGGHNIFPPGGYGVGAQLFNMGTLLQHTYSVDNRGLILTAFDSSTATNVVSVVAPNIVSIQAEYGRDANSDNVISAGEWSATDPATAAEWQQVKMVRIAIVSRSSQYEKDEVTAAEPTWTENNTTIKLSDIPDWKHYRYRVFQTTIPLRNRFWSV